MLGEQAIRLNLYLSQGLLLLISFIVLLFIQTPIGTILENWFCTENWWRSLWMGSSVGLLVLIVDQVLMRYGRKEWFDDGGINEMLFRHRPVLEIILICLLVAFSEEILFRGIIQASIGLWWSSLIFTVVHVRYLHHPIPLLFVFGVSLLLALLYEVTGNLNASILAHFLIDFVQALMLRFRWLPKSFYQKDEI